ncbi:MAG: sodium-independent anion transporter [Oscillatoriales cyanobacterium CG2_30_44_21]|nr:MAG: sodium-independent anion transporter [Oscillatoriales cyanobacterium CG2_30_44_21]
MNISTLKREWFSNVSADLLSGAVVALALIPESIAFSIIAGVDPKVGLYASFIIAVITGIFGGRPALISAATASTALIMVNLVKDHGINYLFAAGILMGILQIIFGLLKLGKQMKYVPRAVKVGFANALAILIFMAQLPEFTNVPIAVYFLAALTLGIIYLLPLLTRAVPSSLVAIVVTTAISIFGNIKVPTVGDKGDLPSALPSFGLPDVPLNWETLQIILPYSIALAIVGLLATLLTASLVDDLTNTQGDKNREAKGLGLANIVSNLFGGMAGCGMIGQSVINVQSGGRGRLSTFSAGVLLLIFILLLGNWVKQIPMAALASVMIMVSIGTFNWKSIINIRRIPRTETAAMLTTVLITVLTRNLAVGVVTGIALSTVFFSSKIAQIIFVDKVLNDDGTHRTYSVAGQIFFVSVDDLLEKFDFQEIVEKVTIDLTNAHLWDQAAVVAIDQIVLKFRRNGADVELLGMNQASATLVERLSDAKQAN